MRATSDSVAVPRQTNVDEILSIETPFGRPVQWAEVALVTDPGDTHVLNDDRCLVVTSKDLSDREVGPWRDFMLCLLADGATGSSFSPGGGRQFGGDAPRQAGWRASQLAQAAFVERFMRSPEVDTLDRLKDGLRAADRALTDCGEGTLSTTLVALFLSADGTAYAASIGDSVLLVFPPRRSTPGERRLKKLGYEESTSVGSGDTTLQSIEENQLIEQWWPNKEGGGSSTRVAPGTYFVLLSDGISDNLPAAVIDQLLHRHALDRATVALPKHTRERRLDTQKRSGGSTQELGLDNMSAIAVRFDGRRRLNRGPSVARIDDASLVCVLGTHGGPKHGPDSRFGLVCLAGQEQGATAVPSFLRHFIESEHLSDVQDRLNSSFLRAMPGRGQVRFSALAVGDDGYHAFASGGAQAWPSE